MKTKKQKLERVLNKARFDGNRTRDIVNLMVNKAQKYGPIGTFYLKKLIKDKNKYLAGAASSAYAMITGNLEPISNLEFGGLGITLEKHTGQKIIGEQCQYHCAKGKGDAFKYVEGKDSSFQDVAGEDKSFYCVKGKDRAFKSAKGYGNSFEKASGEKNSFSSPRGFNESFQDVNGLENAFIDSVAFDESFQYAKGKNKAFRGSFFTDEGFKPNFLKKNPFEDKETAKKFYGKFRKNKK